MKVVVIGGGASGLVAAINASKNNDVTILERNNICGKKILVTGNGRCNYWNEDQNIENYNSSNVDILKEIVNENNIKETLNFLDGIGIIPKIKDGLYYPFSNQAITVSNALINEVKRNNINIINNQYVIDLKKENNRFIIVTEDNQYIADKVIISTGGMAYPKSGSDGNFYKILQKMGHTIIEPKPALVQITILENLKEIAGVRVDVKIKLECNNQILKEEVGELQFTDYGVSGICAMQLSRSIETNMFLSINLVNQLATTKEEFVEFINKQNKVTNNHTIKELLDALLNYKVTNYILNKLKINESLKYEQLSNNDIEKIAEMLTDFRLTITGTKTFNEAQTTKGGIPLTEINSKTLESLKTDGLYLTGEILDVDGKCGGYNLSFAWISGLLAGRNINND